MLLRIGRRADEAGEIVTEHQHIGEDVRSDTVGPGQSSHALREVARLTRIEHRHWHSNSLQRARPCRFVAAMASITTSAAFIGFNAAANAE